MTYIASFLWVKQENYKRKRHQSTPKYMKVYNDHLKAPPKERKGKKNYKKEKEKKTRNKSPTSQQVLLKKDQKLKNNLDKPNLHNL